MAKTTTKAGQKAVKAARRQGKHILCSSTGDKIWISNATLQEIRHASKDKKMSKAISQRKELVKVPSAKVRAQLYEESASAIQDLEQRQLPTYGGRPWKVTCRFSDQGTSSPYFRWYRGKLELACLPHLVEKIPEPPRFPGFRRCDIDHNDDEEDVTWDSKAADPEEQQRIHFLQERTVSTLSQVAWEYRNVNGVAGGAPIPNVTVKWMSPLRHSCNSRKLAWEHAMELAKNDVFIDRIIYGLGASGKPLTAFYPSRPQALKAGKLRFERDGLWVVGQENGWQATRIQQQEENFEEECEVEQKKPKQLGATPKRQRRMTGVTYFLLCKREEYRIEKQKDAVRASEKRFLTLREAETELRAVWKCLSPDDQDEWKRRANSYELSQRGSKVDQLEEQKPTEQLRPEQNNTAVDVGQVASTSKSGRTGCRRSARKKNASSQASGMPSTEIAANHDSCDNTKGLGVLSPVSKSAAMQTKGNKSAQSNTEVKGVETIDSRMSPSVKSDVKRKRKLSSRQLKMLNHSPATYWRLDPKQIKLCYEAGMDHFDKVMNTVKARDLTHELADGFDVLRERGRGRYDMELPIFDTPIFDFLTDLEKAPWMEVVRTILGEDVVLIHKGIFLSLPGAQKQEYHQDGIHLSTQTQRPCHAINVFIPLVDLQRQLGPTEFCLGTHILGQEHFDKDFLDTPLVKAGTPVIFDYRLGHRGLGNTSSSCRPIVYCSYARAADGKEFRDSVNFSRRRYRRLGDLIDRPLSRQERSLKRKQTQEAMTGEQTEET